MAMSNKKENSAKGFPFCIVRNILGLKSAHLSITVASSVCQDGHVKHLAATGAFPGVEGTYKVEKSFSEHATFASWTFHNADPPWSFSIFLYR
jgi:hypothetical protein